MGMAVGIFFLFATELEIHLGGNFTPPPLDIRRCKKNFGHRRVKPLQYFTGTLCLSSLIHQSRLIFWKRMHMSHNINLCILSQFVLNRKMSVRLSVCPSVRSPIAWIVTKRMKDLSRFL